MHLKFIRGLQLFPYFRLKQELWALSYHMYTFCKENITFSGHGNCQSAFRKMHSIIAYVYEMRIKPLEMHMTAI